MIFYVDIFCIGYIVITISPDSVSDRAGNQGTDRVRMPITAYNQMAQTLRDRILSATWKPGAQLPTELELCGQFAVSRITVRRALQILEEEALVLRHQGRGTFVNARPERKIPIVNGNFSASVLRHAPDLKRLVQTRKWQAAPAEWARPLGIPAGERVLFVRRLDFIRRRPIAMDEVVLVGRYADQLTEADCEAVPFEERWQARQRLAMDYETQVIEAVPAAKPVTAWLKTPRGYPLLKETNVVILRDGRAAGLFTSFYRCEYYQFHSIARLRERSPAIGGNRPNQTTTGGTP